MTDSLSAAVLVDGVSIDAWQRQSLEELTSSTAVEIDLLLINERRSSSESTGLLETLLGMSAWEYYRAYRRRRDRIPARTPHDLDEIDCLDDATRHRCQPVATDGFGNELPASAVERLTDCDIAVRFGFGVLLGEALTAPTHGVVSYHCGDLSSYRGRPAGFWEFLHGEPEVGITLQRLTETLDGGEIVAFDTVAITDAGSWPAVQQRIFEAAPPVLTSGIETLADPTVTPQPPEQLGTLYTTPDGPAVARYLLRAGWKSLLGP